jgi:tetratricopeptide (TPR) repeat protein
MKRTEVAASIGSALLGSAFGIPDAVLAPLVGGLITRLFPDATQRKRVEKLLDRVAVALPEGDEFGEAEVLTARQILQRFDSASDLAKHRGDPERIAAALLRHGESRLRPLDGREEGRVRTMVRATVRAYVAEFEDDPDVMREVHLALTYDLSDRLDAFVRTIEQQTGATEETRQIRYGRKVARLFKRLDPLEKDAGPGPYRQPSLLLGTPYAVVPFHGRDEELRRLRAFREAPESFATLIVAGEGGLGKTRLLMEAIANAEAAGWYAGLLRDDVSPDDVPERPIDAPGPARPLLAVVDYAEERAEQVAAFVEAWKGGAVSKRRLALIVRREALLVQALKRLPRRDAVVVYVEGDLVQRLASEPLHIPPAERPAVFREARDAFAERQDRHDLPEPDLPPDFFGTKADDDRAHFALPLYLHMAALASLDGPPSPRRLALIEAAVERETDYLAGMMRTNEVLAAEHVGSEDLREPLALATLAMAARPPGDEPPPVRAFLTSTAVGDDLQGKRRATDALVDVLAAAYPAPVGETHDGQKRMDALRPDPLGEGLVFLTLNANPTLLNAVLGPEQDDSTVASTCTVLIRAALVLASPTGSREEIADWLARHTTERAAHDSRLARVLLNSIEWGSVAFRGLAADWAATLVTEARRNHERTPDVPAVANLLAALLDTLGSWRWFCGRHEEALAATEEAVATHRRLAAAHPNAFEPELAMSLSNLGVKYAALGRREAALAATEEAVAVHRQFAATRPETFGVYLAGSLSNLGNRYTALGQHEEALAAEEEATVIRRRLAAVHPATFEPDLARSLNNLGGIYAMLGRREEGLAATEEAVAVRRRLVAARPDAFERDLAASLSNLGIRLAALGRREEGLAATEEAVSTYRELAAAHPAAFEPELATSLSNLGNRLADLGQHEEALAAEEEATAIRRRLAAVHPAAFEPELAASLSNLGIRLADLGRREKALNAAREAVEIYRGLATTRPDAFQPDLAQSLGALGSHLQGAEWSAEAVDAFAEGLRLLTPFAQRLPAAFLQLLLSLARDYIRACEASDHEPSDELLAPVVELLRTQQGDEPEPPAPG